jgi:hypothetical protein
MPGDKWYQCFLKRHPTLTPRTAEAVSNAGGCVSKNDIQKWFTQIGDYFKQKNYLDILNDSTRNFNGDETFFEMCPKLNKVVTTKGTKNVYEIG